MALVVLLIHHMASYLPNIHTYVDNIYTFKLIEGYLQTVFYTVNVYGERSEIVDRVHQGSIEGPLSFNIFIHDTFLLNSYINIDVLAGGNWLPF